MRRIAALQIITAQDAFIHPRSSSPLKCPEITLMRSDDMDGMNKTT
jgi:hypothetical protein